MPLVSISHAQRRPLSWANWQATIHHGLPRDLYTFHQKSQGYLAFLGRISPEKRPDQAIEIAKRTGLPLRIAAKVDPADQQYYQSEIEPLLDHPLVEFLGEISDTEKDDFIGNALALVCPYDWPEPFGLVLIEALACGTPVLAYRRGSIPEIIDDGITGFVCESLAEMAEAVERLPLIDRSRCRSAFEERFTADRMARDYVALYERIIEESTIQTSLKIRAIGSRHSSGSAFERRQREMARRIEGSPHV
jgi:glycosyltransferase involved in cell wall biosynthesis